MKASINKSEILTSVNKTAWNLVRKAGKTWKEAIKSAWQCVKNQAKVIVATTSQFFEIIFVKASTGEVTTRKASNAKVKDSNLLFFSVDDNGFRQAIIDKIIDVKPLENVNLILV
jgi:hypothetical protein